MGWLYEENLRTFLIMTVVLAGGAAFLAGQALAGKWRPVWMAVAYMAPLGLALRFFHFALFQGTLLSFYYFVVETLVLIGFALLGYRLTRTRQMTGQYPWLYEKTGPLTWRKKGPG